MKDVFNDKLVRFTTIWYMLWPSGIFHGYLVYFPRFDMFYQEKSGITGRASVTGNFRK
jgi:hypothetical protein